MESVWTKQKGYILFLSWNDSFHPKWENLESVVSDYFLRVNDWEKKQKSPAEYVLVGYSGPFECPRISQCLTTCRHIWWTVFFCQRQPVWEEKRDPLSSDQLLLSWSFISNLQMHVNVISFHTSARENRNQSKAPSHQLWKCPNNIIRKDGLWMIGIRRG